MSETPQALDLRGLIPSKELVYVGDTKFEMREPSILQTKAVLAVAADVELERLVEPFVLLFGDAGDEKTQAEGLSKADAAKLAVKRFLERVKKMGAQLVGAARPVLGKQFAPAVEHAAVACLDSRRFLKMLIKCEILKDVDIAIDVETDDEGTYIRCGKARAWIREEMTTRQAIHVLASALKMIDVAGSVGNLIGALMPEGETPETPDTTAQTNNTNRT